MARKYAAGYDNNRCLLRRRETDIAFLNVRHMKSFKGTKYIFLSAAMSPSIINLAFECGADYYFL